MKRKYLIMLILVTTVVILSACGKENLTITNEDGDSVTIDKDKDGEFSFSSEDKDGNKVSMESDGENVSINSESEDGSKVTLDTKDELPEGFPEYIPFPTEYKIVQTMTIDSTIIVSYDPLSAPLEDIVDLYKEFANSNGYEITNDFNAESLGSHVLHLKKGSEFIGFSINYSEGEANAVQITIGEE